MRALDTTEAILAEADFLNDGYTLQHLRRLTGATRTQLRILERDGLIPKATRLPNGTRLWRPYAFVEAVRIVRRWRDGHGEA